MSLPLDARDEWLVVVVEQLAFEDDDDKRCLCWLMVVDAISKTQKEIRQPRQTAEFGKMQPMNRGSSEART